ncbi:MAG: hypothetical protein HYX79_08405 [Chloroflexi bacterium]|nr:hypothetical protein [Chloroflexota bacterium]
MEITSSGGDLTWHGQRGDESYCRRHLKVISHIDGEAVCNQVKEEVAHMCSRFPVPGIDE